MQLHECHSVCKWLQNRNNWFASGAVSAQQTRAHPESPGTERRPLWCSILLTTARSHNITLLHVFKKKNSNFVQKEQAEISSRRLSREGGFILAFKIKNSNLRSYFLACAKQEFAAARSFPLPPCSDMPAHLNLRLSADLAYQENRSPI